MANNLLLNLLLKVTKQGKGFDNAKKELVGLEKQSGKTEQGLAGLGKALAAGTAAAGAAAAAFAVAKKAWDLGELGARMNDVENNLVAFAGGMREAEEATRAVAGASSGTINNMEAMAVASRMLQMGIAETTSDMDLYVRGAVRLGDQTQSSGQRVQEMIGLLKNLNINMLDNFGLSRQVVMGRVEELQATRNLSREEAMLISIREELGRQLEVVGEQSNEGALAIDQMKVAVDNLKLAVAEGLAPAVTAVAKVLADTANSMLGNTSITEELDERIHVLQMRLYDLEFSGQGASEMANQLRGRIAAMEAATDSATLAVYGYEKSVSRAGAAAADAAGSVSDLTSKMVGLWGTMKGMPDSILEKLPKAAQWAIQAYREGLEEIQGIQEGFVADGVRGYLDLGDAGAVSAEETALAYKSAYSDIKSTIESALSPTSVSALDFVGEYVDKWDENARRLDAIAERGFAELEAHPEWADILQIPESVLAAGSDALKAWAGRTAGEVRNLFRPDMLNVKAAADAVEQYMRNLEAKEHSIQLVIDELVGRGFSREKAEAQVKDAYGEETGESAGAELFKGISTGMTDSSLVDEFTSHFKTDVDAKAAGIKKVGRELWGKLDDGIQKRMEDAKYSEGFLAKLSPVVGKWLLDHDWGGGGGSGGGSGGQQGFQHGGEFTVGGPPGIDRTPVHFMASRGERVTVTPAGQSGVETHHHYNLTVNSGATMSDVMGDFGFMEALSAG